MPRCLNNENAGETFPQTIRSMSAIKVSSGLQTLPPLLR